jgi:DNA polymerase III psi subunit
MTLPHPNDPLVRDILRAYRLKPRHVGLALAIDGQAYRRRQRNRVKRRRR